MPSSRQFWLQHITTALYREVQHAAGPIAWAAARLKFVTSNISNFCILTAWLPFPHLHCVSRRRLLPDPQAFGIHPASTGCFLLPEMGKASQLHPRDLRSDRRGVQQRGLHWGQFHCGSHPQLISYGDHERNQCVSI